MLDRPSVLIVPLGGPSYVSYAERPAPALSDAAVIITSRRFRDVVSDMPAERGGSTQAEEDAAVANARSLFVAQVDVPENRAPLYNAIRARLQDGKINFFLWLRDISEASLTNALRSQGVRVTSIDELELESAGASAAGPTVRCEASFNGVAAVHCHLDSRRSKCTVVLELSSPINVIKNLDETTRWLRQPGTRGRHGDGEIVDFTVSWGTPMDGRWVAEICDDGRGRATRIVDAQGAWNPPTRTAGWLSLGRWALEHANVNTARECLPHVPALRVGCADLLNRTGAPKDALALLGAKDAWLVRAHAHYLLDEYEDARASATRFLETREDGAAYLIRGVAALQLGHLDDAVSDLLTPDQLPIQSTRMPKVRGYGWREGTVILLQQAGRHDVALQLLDAVSNPSTDLLLRQALSLTKTGDVNTARLILETAHERGSSEALALLTILPPRVSRKRRTREKCDFDIDDRVRHKRFGPGTVVDVIDGAKPLVVVDFEGEERTLPARALTHERSPLT